METEKELCSPPNWRSDPDPFPSTGVPYLPQHRHPPPPPRRGTLMGLKKYTQALSVDNTSCQIPLSSQEAHLHSINMCIKCCLVWAQIHRLGNQREPLPTFCRLPPEQLFVLKQLPQQISFLKETPLHFKGKLPLIPCSLTDFWQGALMRVGDCSWHFSCPPF